MFDRWLSRETCLYTGMYSFALFEVGFVISVAIEWRKEKACRDLIGWFESLWRVPSKLITDQIHDISSEPISMKSAIGWGMLCLVSGLLNLLLPSRSQLFITFDLAGLGCGLVILTALAHHRTSHSSVERDSLTARISLDLRVGQSPVSQPLSRWDTPEVSCPRCGSDMLYKGKDYDLWSGRDRRLRCAKCDYVGRVGLVVHSLVTIAYVASGAMLFWLFYIVQSRVFGWDDGLAIVITAPVATLCMRLVLFPLVLSLLAVLSRTSEWD